MKKYHKIQKSREKQNDFSTFFLSQQDNKSTSLQGKLSQSRIERRGYLFIEDIQLHIHNYQLSTTTFLNLYFLYYLYTFKPSKLYTLLIAAN